MLLLIFATNSGLVVYGTYLFSIHMLAHMLLSMAVPLLLVLGAPVTLASRAIAGRKDGSRGTREWILVAVHSRYLAIIGHPVVAAAIFGLSLIVFYYSPLFEWALREHLGHLWMTAHFVFSGYLFCPSTHRHRPKPPQSALSPAADYCLGHHGIPCFLRVEHHSGNRASGSRMVWGDGSHLG